MKSFNMWIPNGKVYYPSNFIILGLVDDIMTSSVLSYIQRTSCLMVISTRKCLGTDGQSNLCDSGIYVHGRHCPGTEGNGYGTSGVETEVLQHIDYLYETTNLDQRHKFTLHLKKIDATRIIKFTHQPEMAGSISFLGALVQDGSLNVPAVLKE